MAVKMQQSHHLVAVKLNEQVGTKRGYTFIQSYRAWLPKFLVLYVLGVAFMSMSIYKRMDDDNKVRRKEALVSMCDQRARMLKDQFSVSVNHVHALAILVSTFHYYKNPSAIDQVRPSTLLIEGYLGNVKKKIFCFSFFSPSPFDFLGSPCVFSCERRIFGMSELLALCYVGQRTFILIF